MTNPNPSPELKDLIETLRQIAYRQRENFAGPAEHGAWCIEVAAIAYEDATRALSPQTLPAPGEVEDVRKRAQSIWDKRWFFVEGEWSPDEEPIETDEPRRFAEIAVAALSPTLATVAAANDEGVAESRAEALLPYTSHAIGCAIYQRSWGSGAPECTCGLEDARDTVLSAKGEQ